MLQTILPGFYSCGGISAFIPDTKYVLHNQTMNHDVFGEIAYDQYVLKERLLSPLGWVCPLPQRKEEGRS